MRNPNYRTLFPSKYAEEPSFTFESLLFSGLIFIVIFMGCNGFPLSGKLNLIVVFYPLVLPIPIIIIYLIIKNNYDNPVLLEISMIIFIIELFIIAVYLGKGYGNTPRPLLNIFFIINVFILHIVIWAAFFIPYKLIRNICMAIMIGIALFDTQYSMVMSGFFNGYPFSMVGFWLEPCIGSVKARHWDIHSTVKNLAICTSIGMLITLLDILYKRIIKLIKLGLSYIY